MKHAMQLNQYYKGYWSNRILRSSHTNWRRIRYYGNFQIVILSYSLIMSSVDCFKYINFYCFLYCIVCKLSHSVSLINSLPHLHFITVVSSSLIWDYSHGKKGICVSQLLSDMFWGDRNSIQLLEKNDQLIRELKHLDTTQTQW